jgi:hypothetical protein
MQPAHFTPASLLTQLQADEAPTCSTRFSSGQTRNLLKLRWFLIFATVEPDARVTVLPIEHKKPSYYCAKIPFSAVSIR